MLTVLGLIDVVMIANLLIMVIIGGYETFVSKIKVDGHPDQPEWLSHVNANVLKVKLAMAIIGISSIHLLKTFIEVGDMTETGTGKTEATARTTPPTGVMWQVIIHVVFILSALALAWIDRMSYHHVAPGETHDGVVVPLPPALPSRASDSTAASASRTTSTTRCSARATDLNVTRMGLAVLECGAHMCRFEYDAMASLVHLGSRNMLGRARAVKHENPR